MEIKSVSHADEHAGEHGTRRDFLYFATAGAGTVAAGAAAWTLVNQMNPSADVQALSSIQVDISGVEVGSQLTVKWLGKPVFINAGRGKSQVQADIVAAIRTGILGGASLDVFAVEPVEDPADPLLAHPHVIPTPHIGFVTAEELDRQFADIFAIVNDYAAGTPSAMINPEVWTADRRAR